MPEWKPKQLGPVVIKAASSNTLSDTYRDSIAISYQFIGSSVPEIRFQWGDRVFSTPIMAGPIGGPERKGEDGTLNYARAVRDAGAVFWTGYHEKDVWARILSEGIPAVRVIKPLADLDRFLEEVRLDTERGAIGYATDINHALTVYGELDSQEEDFGPKTVEDLRRINDASPLPFFIKGILSVHDALLAKEAGVTGIVLSGHNNRFPCTVPPLRLLPEVRKAVGSDLRIFVDGGLNNGYDAFKALALGADGVLTARGLVATYLKDGAEGTTNKLLEMTAELKGAMANTGSPDLQHINSDALVFL